MLRNPIALLATAVTLLVSGSLAHAEPFSRPEGLQPNIRFWTRIYSEVDSQGGLIHDSRHLEVVYEVIRYPAGLSRRNRERRVEKTKRQYVAILKQLARGKRTGLSEAESRVLGLWPEGVSNATLKAATRNVRFQLGQADRFRAGLARSGAWRDYVEQVLGSAGVPLELAALPHVESSYNPAAYSRVGAAGLWQFTRSTGRLYMRVDNVVDERLDVRKATVAASKLLRHNYERLGAWPLAITAYNHGVGGMARAVRKMGTSDMATISKHYKGRTFGFASRNFYAEFLAALDVDRNAERYFGPIQPDRPQQVDTLVLDHFYAPSTLARALRIDVETLRTYNRALRPSVWNGNKYIPRGYELEIPRNSLTLPASEVLASIPAGERKSKQHRDRFHKVRRGDTLSKIASRYRVRERDLVLANNLRSRHRIRAGQVLVLPDHAAGGKVVVARSEPPADGIYRVRRGDNVTIIAKRFGVDEAALVAENGLRNRNRIAVGQRLRIPGVAKVASAQPATAPRVAAADTTAAKPAAASDTAAAKPVAVADATAAKPVAVAAAATPRADAAATRAPAPKPSSATTSEPAPAPEAEPARAAASEGAAKPPAAPASAGLPANVPVPDPSDYAVDARGRITVQAAETLGHYADWLEVKTSRLRRANGLRYDTPVVIGRKTKLDFSRVTPETFERRRLAYHHALQEEYFAAFEVTGTRTHTLRPGDSLWYLAERKYQIPIWLIRQFNPDLDLGRLTAGTRMVIPEVGERTS